MTLRTCGSLLIGLGATQFAAGIYAFDLISDGAVEVSPITPPDLAERIRWAWAVATILVPGGALCGTAGLTLRGASVFFGWRHGRLGLDERNTT